MPASAPVRTRRWQAIAITVVVGAMALGSAAAGWWYARESPPHQGPIVVIAVDGLKSRHLSPANVASTSPALDELAADGVTFTRAYAHAPLILPSYTTLLTGRLPFEHGVRDDGGFVLRPEVRTLAELLRNRGFSTGGAVATYRLRRQTGIAQGFGFFDDALTAAPDDAAVERSGERTVDAALQWLGSQTGQRFFLFIQVPKVDAEAVVGRVVASLKDQSLYESATMLLVGGRGTTNDGAALDDESLGVAFVVKQPYARLKGGQVSAPVQLADVAPTVLDLVRAPLPGGLHGRSLRPLLDDADGSVPARPFYAESLAGYYRLGTAPLYALTTETRRLVRDLSDTVVAVAPSDGPAPTAEPVPDTVPLGAVLDELVAGNPPARPESPSLDEESRLASAGFLAGPDLPSDAIGRSARADSNTLAAHGKAARLVGAEQFAEAIRALQAIVKAQPALAAVHFQIGQLLARTGRLDEAAATFTRAEQAWPDSLPMALALSDVLRRGGKLEQARVQAEAAVARAERGTPRDRVAAHDSAARVALALRDVAAATSHAAVSAEVDPTSQLPQFVKGRLLFDAGKYEEAVEAFSEGDGDAAAEETEQAPVAELELYKGESLARLERTEDAAAAFRSEIEAFPRDPRAYLSLATLYQSTQPENVEDVLGDLLEAVPTPEGYGLAAAAWASAGNTSRANAIRADARVRFRGDPTLSRLLGRGGRR
ncbi:MAG TPA: sulfatase-like hydrolase/transferase [Vicinamibacterales bacterium]